MGKSNVVVVVIAACAVFGAERAAACGGLFCSQSSPSPVDQAAERILFEVLDDGSVSATVEIKYVGNPQDFSWIVPVGGTPDFVEVAGKDELQLLDSATALNFIPPPNSCPQSGPSFNFGCAEALSAAAEGENDAVGGSGVNVVEYPSVGPFDDIVVVDGGSADVLMTWLRDHDYQVTEAMRPFIEQYIVEGYSFLATRLRADATTQDMVPIRFHCPQPFPEIPLRLTAISAEPEMGFLVFIAGDARYAPRNYADVEIADADLRMGFGDPSQARDNSNYFGLVSKRIDDAGGRGFVTEAVRSGADVENAIDNVFLGSETEGASRERLREVLRQRGTITRLYARMNPEEMTEDPVFAPSGNALKPSTLDLSEQRGQCGLDVVPTCGSLYCGDGDGCAGSDFGDGCVCKDGHVARAISAPAGGQQVACMPPEIDLHASAGDVCAGSGHGQEPLALRLRIASSRAGAGPPRRARRRCRTSAAAEPAPCPPAWCGSAGSRPNSRCPAPGRAPRPG